MNKINLTYIIDDDNLLVSLVEALINKPQFCDKTLNFKHGQKAIEHLKMMIEKGGALPDVILLDLNMPVMDGWQFLDEFINLRISKKINIFIISSSIDPLDVEKAKNYSIIKDFVMKPINKEKLSVIKEQCLKK